MNQKRISLDDVVPAPGYITQERMDAMRERAGIPVVSSTADPLWAPDWWKLKINPDTKCFRAESHISGRTYKATAIGVLTGHLDVDLVALVRLRAFMEHGPIFYRPVNPPNIGLVCSITWEPIE